MKKTKKPSCLSPDAATLVKLGSIAVHVDEMLSADGHAFDKIALQQLLMDPAVTSWIKEMTSMAMLPVKRKA